MLTQNHTVLVAIVQEYLRERDPSVVTLTQIEKGASGRKYYRISHRGKRAGIIAMVYTDERVDNCKYFTASDILKRRSVNVPSVFYHDQGLKVALVQDLGSTDLLSQSQVDWTVLRESYLRTLELAARLHQFGEEDLSIAERESLMPPFSSEIYLWEQNYFFDNYVAHYSSADKCTASDTKQCAALRHLREELSSLPASLVHRDLQAENILIFENQAYLIDFQGLRFGRPEYDIASLIYDPYMPLVQEHRSQLWESYKSLRTETSRWHTSDELLVKLGVQRLMQALGAYALFIRAGNLSYRTPMERALVDLRNFAENNSFAACLIPVLGTNDSPLKGKTDKF